MKGPTVLALHPPFDLVWGVVIDDLHDLFLGVSLSLLRLWFDKSHGGKPHFIGSKVYINQCIHVLLVLTLTSYIAAPL